MLTRRTFLAGGASLVAAAAAVGLAACGAKGTDVDVAAWPVAGAWSYDEAHDAYWRVGLVYCEAPVAPEHESLGLFVPASLMRDAEAAAAAPMVLPVVTDGYASLPAPTEADVPGLLDAAAPFLEAGLVYVRAGCRGREHGAPAGVCDLKAAVRWLRHHRAELPGNPDALFSFGHSGGGAQSALLGASGNSERFSPYLEKIGAAGESDAVAGAMCWCPVTSLGAADAAYEWAMGRFCREGADAELSEQLAESFPDYVCDLGLVGPDGRVVQDEKDYLSLALDVIGTSLDNWLADHPELDAAASVAELNEGAERPWVALDASGHAVVSDLGGFVRARKRPDKPVPAFDRRDLSSPENELFGGGGRQRRHFAALPVDETQGTAGDLAFVDGCGVSQEERVRTYDPLTYLLGTEAADVAPHWRISCGIRQPDTSLTTELNLALALGMRAEVEDVEFAEVWDQAHVMAERCGTPEDAVIRWVHACTGFSAAGRTA